MQILTHIDLVATQDNFLINPNKSKYKICNWQAYDKNLCNRATQFFHLRGSFEFLQKVFSADIIEQYARRRCKRFV